MFIEGKRSLGEGFEPNSHGAAEASDTVQMLQLSIQKQSIGPRQPTWRVQSMETGGLWGFP